MRDYERDYEYDYERDYEYDYEHIHDNNPLLSSGGADGTHVTVTCYALTPSSTGSICQSFEHKQNVTICPPSCVP